MMNTSTSMRKAELVIWERTKRPFGTVRMTSSSRRRSSHWEPPSGEGDVPGRNPSRGVLAGAGEVRVVAVPAGWRSS
mgnify:CR=1 FL=1